MFTMQALLFAEEMIDVTGVFGVLYFLVIVGAVYWIFIRRTKDSVRSDDFEYLSVREQIATANETAETISELEELITDMQESKPRDVMVLHVEWIGRDNEKHAIDLSCDGRNTCTDAMVEICDAEINGLKNTLAYQCAVLSGDIRHRQNRRKNERARKEGIDLDETVSALRSQHLNG